MFYIASLSCQHELVEGVIWMGGDLLVANFIKHLDYLSIVRRLGCGHIFEKMVEMRSIAET